MENSGDKIQPFEKIPTGIKGLDTLLNGGFLKGGVYLLMGPPGSGKTILANQLSFHHVRSGGRALYVTLLAESHNRMMGNLSELSFFDADLVSDSLVYIGAYQTLEKEGLGGLLRLLGESVRKFKADLLFIDGVASAEEVASSSLAFKKFVHQLNSVLSTSGCTTFLLSSLDGNISHPEHTMVDGIVGLTLVNQGMRTQREIEIRKFRGSGHLQGRHFCKISETGMSIYPRIESYLGRTVQKSTSLPKKRPIGVTKLDAMLCGGLTSGTVTSLLGPAGTSKTLLGSHFLATGAQAGESSLYFGLYEVPERVVRKAEDLGLPLSSHLKKGTLEILWQPPTENEIDELADRILERVKTRGVKRLFIDGVGGLREGMFGGERLHPALAALANELRNLDVTTLFTEETALFSPIISSPISDLSAVTDNIITLKHVELRSELKLFLTVLKTRESQRDQSIHEVQITSRGIQIGKTYKSADALLSSTPSTKTTKSRRKPKAKSGRRR